MFIGSSPCLLLAAREHKKNWLLSFEGIDSLAGAKKYEGQELFITKKPESLFSVIFYEEVIGKDVYDQKNNLIGKAAGLIKTGTHDILEVRSGEREKLIPLIAEFIKEVKKDMIIVDIKNLEEL